MLSIARHIRDAAAAGTMALMIAMSTGCLPAVGAEDRTATPAIAGDFKWRALAAGFEVAEMPIMSGGQEVDLALLTRIDPAKYRFTIRHDAAGNTIDSWREKLGAVMVVNGSFFTENRMPVTPILSEGARLGPKSYTARHGAFVAADGAAGVHDLRKQDWRKVLSEAKNATVSFPLLVGGQDVVAINASDRQSSRTFVAQDTKGRVLFGTTYQPWFTLPDLARFLKSSPLKLTTALNLDGGPYACQVIDWQGFYRQFCNFRTYDTKQDANQPGSRGSGHALRLPIVIGVVPR